MFRYFLIPGVAPCARRTFLAVMVALLGAGSLLGLATAASHTAHAQPTWGRFTGPLRLEGIQGDQRSLRVLSDFGYVGPMGKRWMVPRGTIVNGASIPRALWPLAGSPWVGFHRNASVIHDYFWVVRSRTWQETHTVFYQAMRASGASSFEAHAKFWPVWFGSERWTVDKRAFRACSRRLARQRRIAVRKLTAFCAETFEGKGQITWQPKVSETAISELVRMGESGVSFDQLKAKARELLLRTDPSANFADQFDLLD